MVGKLSLAFLALAFLTACSGGGDADPTVSAPTMTQEEKTNARADTMTAEQRKMLDSRPR